MLLTVGCPPSLGLSLATSTCSIGRQTPVRIRNLAQFINDIISEYINSSHNCISIVELFHIGQICPHSRPLLPCSRLTQSLEHPYTKSNWLDGAVSNGEILLLDVYQTLVKCDIFQLSFLAIFVLSLAHILVIVPPSCPDSLTSRINSIAFLTRR